MLLILAMTSCGVILNQPIQVSEARIASKTNLEKTLIDLPKPSDPVVVAVYKFKDQTGQYKPTEIGSSFSTAVTQGGTNILIKALDDSGWFKVIERENIGNLLNERKIIRQTRMQYDNSSESKLLVNPLLFAGVILEGGIVSYDANILTGGIGVRYFGSGGSAAYRQDRVTVYLRAIATKTGEVLKNITTSKTILSQSIDGGVFRYVKFSRLLEAETGITFNEPSDIAVTEALQKAVYSLILEGIKSGLWNVDASYKEEAIMMMEEYDREITEGDLENYLGVKTLDKVNKFSVSSNLFGTYYQGDFPYARLNLGGNIAAHYELNKNWGLSSMIGIGRLSTVEYVDKRINPFSVDLRYKFLQNAVRNPYLKIGLGSAFTEDFSNSNPKVKAGLGIDLYINKNSAINLSLDYNQFLRDDFDGLESGRYIDYYYQFGIGFKHQFNRKKIIKE